MPDMSHSKRKCRELVAKDTTIIFTIIFNFSSDLWGLRGDGEGEGESEGEWRLAMTLFETLIHSSCFVDRLLPPFFFPLPKNDCDPAQSLPSARPDRARCPGPAIRALAGQTTRDHLSVHRRFCPRSRSVQSPHGYDSYIRHRRSKR